MNVCDGSVMRGGMRCCESGVNVFWVVEVLGGGTRNAVSYGEAGRDEGRNVCTRLGGIAAKTTSRY